MFPDETIEFMRPESRLSGNKISLTEDCIKVIPKDELLKKQLMVIKKPPLKDYIPKKATQQDEFLKKYPEYDGRGLLIAIIDSGIDVSMPGLQKTTTGLPKIIDCFDFSGTGNVDTSHVTKAPDNNILIGLSGRELKIPSHWKNPSGEWHLGTKSYFDLCAEMDRRNLKKTEIVTNKIEKNGIIIETLGSSLSRDTVLDCIVWFNGEKWQACVDTSFSKDLENIKILKNFRDEHEYGFLPNQRSFCVTIDNDGKQLVIHFIHFEHGTVVSQVAAANFPDEPDRNGLAPGAQIVAFNCLSHHTKTVDIKSYGEVFKKCIELKVDVINISLRIIHGISDFIKEAVNHGIIIVTGAGNDGPIYSSINKSYNDDNMFVIGAIISPEIRTRFYENEEETPALFPYSSKGPSADHQCGVDFVADGVAVGNFPKWSPVSTMVCNGTSGSSPIVAGSIACLISALKANSIEYSPTTLKLALSNTAHLPKGGDRLGFGNGIIQIESAFEYFKNFQNAFSKLEIPKLFCGNKKGILWIKKKDDPISNFFDVTIQYPSKDNFHIPWNLKLTSGGERFIQHSDTVCNGIFTVTIDTSLLKLGKIYYAEIHGTDSSNPSVGTIFKFPITVIIPKQCKPKWFIKRKVNLKPWTSNSIFLYPPLKSKKCNIKVTSLEEIPPYFSDTLIRYGYENLLNKFLIKSFTLNPENSIQTFTFPIKSNKMYEIAIFRDDELERGTISTNLKYKFEINFDKKEKNTISKK